MVRINNDCVCGHELSAHERVDIIGSFPFCHAAKCGCRHYWKNYPCTVCGKEVTTCWHEFSDYMYMQNIQERIE